MSMNYRDENDLRETYHRLGSMSKTADEFGVATSTIKRWINRFGIEKNPAPQDVESIDVECENCGEGKEVIPSQFKMFENHYCDISCQVEAEDRSGEIKGKIEVECGFCSSIKEIFPSRKDKENHFCSVDCYSKWQSKNRTGSDHHQYKSVTTECEWCSGEIHMTPSRLEKSDIYFCDLDCHGKWNSQNLTGEKNPNWDGGIVYYGESWYEMRRKVRDRDENTCQLCGKDEDDLGMKPAVHHIKPVRSFKTPEESHTMENMIQVCQPCYMSLEKLPESEQREAISGQSQSGLSAFC